MKKIHKYELPSRPADTFAIRMPVGARILDVQMQATGPSIWAVVEVDAPLTHRVFVLRGTGFDADGLEEALYVGTFQIPGPIMGTLVYHLFDAGEGEPSVIS